MRKSFVAAALAAIAGVASAGEVFQVDTNALTAEASGKFSTTFTGSLSVFSTVANPDMDGDAEILDVLIDGVNQGTGGAAFGAFEFMLDVTFVGGSITGGSVEIIVADNSYTATLSATSDPSIIKIGPNFLIGGLTFDGNFSDASGTFLGIGITPWGSTQPVPGNFAQIEFSPDSDNLDLDTDVDVFVLIPMPSAAGLAGLGLVGLATRRRR